MNTSMTLNHGRRLSGVAACLSSAALLLSGCLAGSADSEPANKDGSTETSEVSAFTPLDRPSNAKLRVVSWNTDRGSVFPKTDDLWKAINRSGMYDPQRTTAAARIFKSVRADIWLLQETVYSDSPTSYTVGQINAKIQGYMVQITGDSSWKVTCNGQGLCMMSHGNISVVSTCQKTPRANAYLVKLNNWGGVSLLLANSHYMTLSQANYTKSIITGSNASAYYMGGDFNDVPGGALYNAIDGIASPVAMSPIDMRQPVDPAAIHLSSSAKSASPDNTKGYVDFANSGSNSVVNKAYGGNIDHFFLGSRSNTWVVRNHITLNTLLFSKATLSRYGLTPLDVALSPGAYAQYFSSFMTTGTVRQVPSSLTKLDHDHLPLVVDLDFPSQSPALSASLACP
jgi:hypothetical protein